MHELIMAQQILRTLLAEAKRRGASRVRAAEVRIGELEGIRDAELRQAFEIQAAGTPLDGTELRVTILPALASCALCGTERPLRLTHEIVHSDLPLACPACGLPLQVRGERGFQILSATMVLPSP